MYGKTSAIAGTRKLVDDETKDTVVFVNDFYLEYWKAFQKFSKKIGRPLRGILLVDDTAKEQHRNRPDKNHHFEEVICDFSDVYALRATIKAFEDRLLLVSSSAESSQLDFQKVLPHVPYILGPSERSLEWATHKAKMRAVIGGYNKDLVPKIKSVNSNTEAEIKAALAELRFPMIVKPTGLVGSALVQKVHNEHELRQAISKSFAMLHDVYRREGGNGTPGMLVEEFIKGTMFSVDAYVSEVGELWLLPPLRGTTAHELGYDGFYVYQWETDHMLDDAEYSACMRAAEDAVRALGLRASLAHIELFKTADGWKICELGARPGGTRQEAYEVSYGVDHAYNELLIKVGLQPETHYTLLTHSMVLNFNLEDKKDEGILESIDGLENARQHPSVYKLHFSAKKGDAVRLNSNGGVAIGNGLLRHDDPEQLRRDAEQVRSFIRLNVREHIDDKALPYIAGREA